MIRNLRLLFILLDESGARQLYVSIIQTASSTFGALHAARGTWVVYACLQYDVNGAQNTWKAWGQRMESNELYST